MSKKWYNYFVSVDEQGDQPPADESDPGSQGQSQQSSAAQAVADIAASIQITPKFAPPVAGGPPTTFDEIYRAAEIQAPPHGFTVFKVAEMLQSGHIKDLPSEIKRSSVLLALEAAGVKIQEVIEDAVRRDKALDSYERVRRRAAEELESRKTEENRQIQAEIDKLMAEHRARMQANTEAILREKESFTTWLREKQKEETKIADAIGHFVSENPVTVGAVADTANRKAPSA
jgi:hypothetical protein